MKLSVLCLWLAGMLLINPGLAAAPQILALNSDGKVNKYRQALQGFLEASSYPVEVLDIGEQHIDDRAIAARIAAEKPDLIYAVGTRAYLLGEKHHGEIPLLFSSVINWQRFPQGSAVYGVAMEVPLSYQFFMYHYFFPGIKRIGVLYSDRYNREFVEWAKRQADELGLRLVPQKMRHGDDLEASLRKLDGRMDALWIVADPVVLSSSRNLQFLFEWTERARVPVFSYEPAFRTYGPVLTISAEPRSMGAQAATLARSLLSGRRTGNKVQEPVGTHITLNLRQVEKLGLKFNEDALDSVTDVIQ